MLKLPKSAKTAEKGREGGGVGVGRTNDRPGTDHVTRGPIRGQKKLHTMAQKHRQTDRQTNIATTRPTQPRWPSW